MYICVLKWWYVNIKNVNMCFVSAQQQKHRLPKHHQQQQQ